MGVVDGSVRVMGSQGCNGVCGGAAADTPPCSGTPVWCVTA
jgi:hypothetical protein